jgi:hypothetical protein
MKHTLIVISKDKLITTDTVAPIVREFKEKTGGKIYFYVPYKHTISYIRENIILYDALSEVSEINYISCENPLKRRFVYLMHLLKWVILSLRGAKFIHFGLLDKFPFNLVSIIKPGSVFLMQNTTFFHEGMDRIRCLAHNRGDINALLYNDYSNTPKIYSGNIIVNNKSNYLINDPGNKNKKIYIVSGTRIRKSWLSYINRRVDLFYKYYNNLNFENGIIVYVIASFEPTKDLRNKNSLKSLFLETMKVLDNTGLDIPILIKPHVFTQMELVHDVLNQMRSGNFFISYFHPTLLAIKAKAWLCNIYSTTCADAYCCGVPTIEYTDYSESMIKAASGKSFGHKYISHFIQRDTDMLNSTIMNYINKEVKNKNFCIPVDDSDLIGSLSSV